MRCSYCKENKPRKAFGEGHRQCRDCRAAKNRAYHRKHRGRILARLRRIKELARLKYPAWLRP